MKFSIGSNFAYVIRKYKNGYTINDSFGYTMEPEQMIELSRGLLDVALSDNGEINKHNKEQDIYFENLNNRANAENEKREATKAHIYLFECEGKYKIGVSKDVDRRLEEIDKRPFETKLIAKTSLIENAYVIERKLHKYYEKQRINGEWYNLTKEQANELSEKLKKR